MNAAIEILKTIVFSLALFMTVLPFLDQATIDDESGFLVGLCGVVVCGVLIGAAL